MRTVAKAWFLLLALGMVAAGCRQGAGLNGRSITIEEPAKGTSISSPVRLVVSVRGAQIGPPESGQMHLHVYVDGGSDYDVVTSTSATIDVPPGRRTLEVVLAQPNHAETDTRASVSVTVGNGQQSPDRGPYDY